jgi:signal transduction histidine kinase
MNINKLKSYIIRNSYINIIFFVVVSSIMLIGVNYLDSKIRLDRLEKISGDCTDMEILMQHQRNLEYMILTPKTIPDKMGIEINNTKIYYDFDVLFKRPNGNLILMKRSDILSYSALLYILFVMIAFNIHIRHLVKTLGNESFSNELIKLQGAEAKLASKNLSLLAENIHHELKTPLVVIVNKLETIRHAMEENEECRNCEIQKTDWIIKDIDLVETHIDVIYNLLDRMKNFKNMKRTTENKSMYEVITVAFQTLELFSKTKFKYKIDPRLRNYKVADKFTNEDMLNVFINHIKNSLEANTTKLEVIMHKYHKNMVYLQLIDNGSGIPEEAQDKIFIPNFSTKEINSNDDETRGIGLYLSKTTLQTCGGDDFLIESTQEGTSFGINIPAMRR